MKFSNFIEQFSSKIDNAKDILIYPHISADGDALGATIALKKYLTKKNKNVKIIIEEQIPRTYKFMCEEDDFIMFNINKKYNANLHIAVDTGDINRLGERKKIFKGNTINIDHHQTNTEFAKLNYIDASASSAGEIIYNVIKSLDGHIDKKIAEAIYVSIATDTGGFRFSNTNENCFKIASELLKYNIDISFLSKKVFDTNPKEKVLLMGKAIEKLQFFLDDKVAITSFKKKEYLEINADEEMFDGIIQIPRNIEGVIVAVVIREGLNNQIKVNLRSNSDEADVSKIAFNNNGGGHKRAAGYTSPYKSIKETQSKLLRDIKEQLKKWN